MKRRTVLKGVTGASVALLAGCAGREREENPLRVASTQITETEDGYAAVRVTVSNVGNHHRKGTLYVTAELNGDSTVRVRDVALDAHATQQYLVSYDVQMSDVQSFSPSADVRPRED